MKKNVIIVNSYANNEEKENILYKYLSQLKKINIDELISLNNIENYKFSGERGLIK